MGVRHGYGKVAGADALVFAYDTGDTRNSYKGEPTENLMQPFPQGTTVPPGANWGSYEYSVSVVDSPIGNHPLSNQKWVKFVKTSNTNGRAGFLSQGYIANTINTFSCYVYAETGNSRIIVNSDNGGLSIISSKVDYDVSKPNTVQRIHGTWTQQVNGGSLIGIRGGSGDAIGTTFYMTGFQVEEKPHPTQLTAGTRSATQGLLDLTGNYTFDLSNVSFTSDAQIDFDGTDDFITLANTDLRPGFTLETVCYPESTTFAVWGQGPTVANRGLHIIATSGGRGFVYGMYGNDCDYQHFPTTNAWHHWVFTYDGTSFQKKFFADGVAQTPSGNTVQNEWLEGSSALRLGTNYGSGTGYSKANGKIAVAKYYNKPLSDAEIINNFNNYKGRFNI